MLQVIFLLWQLLRGIIELHPSSSVMGSNSVNVVGA
jgi:hypothetical protein